MIDKLYQKTILKHAANAIGHGAIQNADHSIMVHNPMCGDRIKVYIKTDKYQLINFSHEAKACALCQASASILGEHFQGLNKDDLKDLRRKLSDSIALVNGPDHNDWPDNKWADLDVFNVVRDHKSRRTCVMLPFDALQQALDEIT